MKSEPGVRENGGDGGIMWKGDLLVIDLEKAEGVMLHLDGFMDVNGRDK